MVAKDMAGNKERFEVWLRSTRLLENRVGTRNGVRFRLYGWGYGLKV